jgi:hypothetical protein
MLPRLPSSHRDLWVSLVVFAAGLGLVGSCSASSSDGKSSSGSSGTGGAEAGVIEDAGKDTGIIVGDSGGGDVDAAPSGPSWIPADLPPPWLYYNETSDRAYKDAALGDVRGAFGGAVTTENVPALVYPLDTAMHPLNLSDITFQWQRGAATNTLFRIDALGEDGRTSRFYVPCTKTQCTYKMPESDWLWLAADYAGKKVTITVSGTDGAGGPVGTSAPIVAHFSPEPVFGALYYWAAATEELKRASFGAKKAVPFITPQSATNAYKCVACHTVSRNGKVIAFAVSNLHGETVAAIQSAPTEDPASPYVAPAMGTTPFAAEYANVSHGGSLENQPTDNFGHMPALNPEGTLMAVNGVGEPDASGVPGQIYLEIREAHTGATVNRYNLGSSVFGGNSQTLPILPEWSPDGRSLVVSLGNYAPSYQCLWTYVTCNSPLAIVPVTLGQLGTPTIIATNSNPDDFHYYPTWSPDGQWVAFQTARRNYDSSNKIVDPRSLGNKNGVIRMVKTSGGPYTCPGPGCVELVRGTQYSWEQALAGEGKQSTWPKFTPFAQGTNKDVMFVSFTTRIPYGFLASGRSQLWMFAVDVSKVESGEDPSFAPIWLPYQDYTDGSLTPYWTETLPCQSDPSGGCSGCVAGETCVVKSNDVCECQGTVVR